MNYHREHIPGYSNLALPLHEVVHSTILFVWEEKHQSAFESLKEALINSVILSFPNSTDMYILDTDASTSTIGVALSQLQNGEEKVINFASRVLSSAQRKYCTRKELLAIVTFTRQFRRYLLGRQTVPY